MFNLFKEILQLCKIYAASFRSQNWFPPYTPMPVESHASFFGRTCLSPSGYCPYAVARGHCHDEPSNFPDIETSEKQFDKAYWSKNIRDEGPRSPILHQCTKLSLIQCVGESDLRIPRIYLILTPPPNKIHPCPTRYHPARILHNVSLRCFHQDL